MGKETFIEWCDSTVNPTGFQCCGCELWNGEIKICYSGTFAERIGGPGAFEKPVELKPGRMAQAARWPDLTGKPRKDKPWLNGRPRVIFLGDMADVLQPGVPFEYLKTEIIDVVNSEAGKRHIWMLLTKQSGRLVQFQQWLHDTHALDWPENLWPGVSITSRRKTYRVSDLIKISSAFKFISYEPAWEYVDFEHWLWNGADPSYHIRMIIMGGQSGHNPKPFHLRWAQLIKINCEHAHVDFFLKQLGSNPLKPRDLILRKGEKLGDLIPLELKHPKGGDWNEWPADLRIRQFPRYDV